jgi:hypothetical protein
VLKQPARPPVLKEDDLTAWREGPHDDLVLGVALAAWLGKLALYDDGD